MEVLYVKLNDNEVDKTNVIEVSNSTVNMDFDKQGFLCGIEVLGYEKLTIGLDALTVDQIKDQKIIDLYKELAVDALHIVKKYTGMKVENMPEHDKISKLWLFMDLLEERFDFLEEVIREAQTNGK